MAIREPIISDIDTRRETPRRHVGRGGLVWLFLFLAVLVIAAIVFGLRPRLARERALAAAAEAVEEKPAAVTVARVRRSPAKSELELPGDLQGYLESPIFARADGYMRRRLVDYGDRVRAGQLLAEIETPELDQQLTQARANLAQSQATLRQSEAALVQANANLKLAEVTLVPPAVVTVMSTVPAASAGEVAVICVALVTVKLAAAVAPNFTAVAVVKLVPVRVTLVPPAMGPLVGLTLVTVGAATKVN